MEQQNNNEKTALTEPLSTAQPTLETQLNTNPVEPLNAHPKPKTKMIILQVIVCIAFVLGFLVFLASKDIEGLVLALIAQMWLTTYKRHNGNQTLRQIYQQKPGAKKGMVYGVVLSIIFIIVVTIVAILNMPPKNDSKTDTPQTAPQNNGSTSISEESQVAVTEKVISDLRSKIINFKFKGYDVDLGAESSGVPVFDESGGYFVRLYAPEGMALHLRNVDSKSTTTNEEVAKFAADTLRSRGFEEYSGKIYEHDVYIPSGITMLQRKNELCKVIFYGGEVSVGLSIECVNLADLEAAAAKLKPFFDAMFAIDSPEREKFVMSLGPPTTNSAYPEYNTAKGGISGNRDPGAGIVFYQKNGGAWVFGYTAQSIKSCTDYKNEDMRKAFYGDDCVDEATNLETTVAEYYRV